ncbi:MAG: nucleotide exchange factor GrpE [Anaerolineae bacterium]|nr:nucleotide exchange factor GrpE [Anaerolineae bacterium]
MGNSDVNGTSEAQAMPEAPEASALEALTAANAEIATLKEQLGAAQAKAAENLDGWLRQQAEFSNYKKRQQNELASLRAMATSDLIKRLLPIIDDFDRAAKNLPEALKDNTWVTGLMLVQRKMQNVLEFENVKLISANPNDKFDPTQHEAISQDDADGIESGNVIEELQRGYKIGDRVLRPSLVRVAR